MEKNKTCSFYELIIHDDNKSELTVNSITSVLPIEVTIQNILDSSFFQHQQMQNHSCIKRRHVKKLSAEDCLDCQMERNSQTAVVLPAGFTL